MEARVKLNGFIMYNASIPRRITSNRSSRSAHVAISVVIGLAVSIFSWWWLPYYHDGDQRYYTSLYNMLKVYGIADALALQKQVIGASEPVYVSIMWVFARALDKIAIISIFNGVLSAVLYGWLSSRKASAPFILLIFTNFYLLVLLTSAERLKFGYLFAVSGLLFPLLGRVVLIILSLFTHFSFILVVIPVVLGEKASEIVTLVRRGSKRAIWSLVTLGIAGAAIGGFYVSNLYAYQDKAAHYLSYDLPEIAEVAILSLVAVTVSSSKVKSSVMMILPVVATYALGGDRMNMLSTTVFIYLVTVENKTSNPLVLAVLAYLSYKSVGYIQNVYLYGTGFLVW